jgi:hypothetical protein
MEEEGLKAGRKFRTLIMDFILYFTSRNHNVAIYCTTIIRIPR